jgi:DNA-binding NarL/FixJ family response regulator
MPRLNGLEALAELKQKFPALKTIVVSALSDEATLNAVKEQGAFGFIAKSDLTDNILPAIKAALAGKKYFSNHNVQEIKPVLPGPDLEELLTPREKEILFHIARGSKNKEIADSLKISVRTVEFHRANLMSKFKTGNTMELIKAAIQQNLV